MTVADVLRDARARYAAAPSHAPSGEDIEPGRVCLIMAISHALAHAPYIDRGRRSAMREVRDAAGASSLIRWNAEHYRGSPRSVRPGHRTGAGMNAGTSAVRRLERQKAAERDRQAYLREVRQRGADTSEWSEEQHRELQARLRSDFYARNGNRP